MTSKQIVFCMQGQVAFVGLIGFEFCLCPVIDEGMDNGGYAAR